MAEKETVLGGGQVRVCASPVVHKEAVPECYEVVSVLHEKALSGSRMPEVVLYDL